MKKLTARSPQPDTMHFVPDSSISVFRAMPLEVSVFMKYTIEINIKVEVQSFSSEINLNKKF